MSSIEIDFLSKEEVPDYEVGFWQMLDVESPVHKAILVNRKHLNGENEVDIIQFSSTLTDVISYFQYDSVIIRTVQLYRDQLKLGTAQKYFDPNVVTFINKPIV